MNTNLVREYPSNTVVSLCNNYILLNDEKITLTGRIFYKVRTAGKLPYRFFFNNACDSTFNAGAVCYANRLGGDLEVIEASVATWCGKPEDFDGMGSSPVTFGGRKGYVAKPGEFFNSDEVVIDVPENCYLVFQWTIQGTDIPFSQDKVIPCYILKDGKWVLDANMPTPFMVGAKRPIRKQICFFGDSITQGLGTNFNTYEFWVAKVAEQLPADYSVMNIGLGFGRAADAASDGYWLEKAKCADLVNICFGVNDMMQWCSTIGIKKSLVTIVRKLKEAGVKVGIFTIPPFDYNEDHRKIWYECDDFIKNELAKECEYCFNTALYWGLDKPEDYKSRWGGHPNEQGCKYLADEFCKQIKL